MKFQPWEHPKAQRIAFREGKLEPGMQAAIDLLRAEAKRAEADAVAFGGRGELADAAWLRCIAAKICSNYLYARLVELKEAVKAEGESNANQT